MKTKIEPFKIKTVEAIPVTTIAQREEYIKKANYNPFSLRSEHITIDLLTDSGTTAMSSKQWAAMMDADESYAGSRSYYKFEDAVKKFTNFKYIIPTHQGRAAERILFKALDVKGKYIPNNTHFDTTRGNIEFSEGTALDYLNEIGKHPDQYGDFKGNMDVQALEAAIKQYGPENVPVCMLTITNNGGGGQPVSMQNIREVKEVCIKYGIPLFLDCCRFAENAFFIKRREKGYENKSIFEIVQEMFSYADGATMSSKKDGLSNTGGFIGTNDEKLADACKTILIVTEGFITYGGLARRDLEALAIGFEEVMDESYLDYRVGQIQYLGDKMTEKGIPIILPVGGHGVFIDAKAFAPHIAPKYYPGQAICNEIYRLSGVRTVEIGSVMFGTNDANGNFVAPDMDLVRLAIPRRVYTQNHLDYIIEAVEETFKNREKLRKMKITWEAPFLRHFTCKMDYID